MNENFKIVNGEIIEVKPGFYYVRVFDLINGTHKDKYMATDLYQAITRSTNPLYNKEFKIEILFKY